MQKHVLMIESNPAGMRAVDAAACDGYLVSFVTADAAFYRTIPAGAQALDNPNVRVYEMAGGDLAQQVIDAASEIQKDVPVDGVVTYSELHTLAAAEVARRLELPGMSPAGARNARLKHRTRTLLAEAGVPQPEFVHAQGFEVVPRAVDTFGYPCIVKPSTGTASLHVSHIASDEDRDRYLAGVRAAERYRGGVDIGENFLVERYVEGSLVSVESCVDRKHGVRSFGITDRRVVGFPAFIEMGGTFHLDHARRDELFTLTGRVLRTLGVDFGFTHTEWLLPPDDSSPLLLECNARLAGGILPVMFAAASGVDPARQVIRLALGMDVELPLPCEQVCTGRQFGSPLAGRFIDVQLPRPSAGLVDVECYAKPGDSVPALHSSNYDWLGHVIYTGRDYDEALKRAASALEQIHMKIEVPAAV